MVEVNERLDRNLFRDQYMQQPAPADPGTQVWCENQLIGWLSGKPAIRGAYCEIPIFEYPEVIASDLDAPDRSIIHRRILLEIVKRGASISEFELMQANYREDVILAFREIHQIPANAAQQRDVDAAGYSFRWTIFKVSLNDSELLFDLDEFTPNPDAR